MPVIAFKNEKKQKGACRLPGGGGSGLGESVKVCYNLERGAIWLYSEYS